MSGWLVVVGLGPGSNKLITPEVSQALLEASDVVGYIPYVERVAARQGLTLHASDNRQENERAIIALQMAAEGRRVVVVSSGDPGVFAMAAAVFEALQSGPKEWLQIDIRVLPGITAMLAASASVGAPLGHDFCCINLSDNLKPWQVLERRLQLAAEGDFAMAFYNPRSKARPEGFSRALEILRKVCEPQRVIIFARSVSTPEQNIQISTLEQAKPEMADMRTLVIVGSSRTKVIENGLNSYVYTPRSIS